MQCLKYLVFFNYKYIYVTLLLLCILCDEIQNMNKLFGFWKRYLHASAPFNANNRERGREGLITLFARRTHSPCVFSYKPY